MNTIPLIFNQRQINRTVLGGKESVRNPQMPVSVILLNAQGSHQRIPVIEKLLKCGFESIVSIEPDASNYNLEDFSVRFPRVKFIVPLEKTTDGDLINIGMSEISSRYALVLRDSLSFNLEILSPRIASRLIESGSFCVAPRLTSDSGIALPTVYSPSVKRGALDVIPSAIASDATSTLFPFDFIGLYDREKFISLGGFDYTIASPYWQNLDLSFRAWLWGEKISVSTLFSLSYAEQPPAPDITVNQDEGRFYIKNMLPRFVSDHGAIPLSAFFVYLPRSGCGFIESAHLFSDAREWTEKNKYRFKRDAIDIIKNWSQKND